MYLLSFFFFTTLAAMYSGLWECRFSGANRVDQHVRRRRRWANLLRPDGLLESQELRSVQVSTSLRNAYVFFILNDNHIHECRWWRWFCSNGDHSSSFLTDLHDPSNPTWWQSETMFEGIHQSKVNLTLNLGKQWVCR